VYHERFFAHHAEVAAKTNVSVSLRRTIAELLAK